MQFRFPGLIFFSIAVLAQPASGPAISVDASAARRPISPLVYGANLFEDPAGIGAFAGITLNRWGGNATSSYNWKNDTINIDADWYFESFAGSADPNKLPDGSRFDVLMEQNRRLGMATINSIPILDLLPKDRERRCSYSIQKYGPQKAHDPWWPDCGNGRNAADTADIQNDPYDVYAQFDESFQAEWVNHLVGKYGKANQGGTPIYSLDNEPVWWMGTHRDMHPSAATYDEVRDRGIRYAAALKAADPTALVTGPVCGGWSDMWFSAADMRAGWGKYPWKYWDNPVDQNTHGGVPFIPWYLSEMKKYEEEHGVRLLDYVDVHAYITPSAANISDEGSDEVQAVRLRSTRTLWDPNYTEFTDEWPRPVEPYRFIPRLREWVDAYYPGTKTAITEYNWGAMGHLSGALAQADILGIFGREGLDLGTYWGDLQTQDHKPYPGAFAFKIYRNYDDMGGTFGETSVSATTEDADRLSVFAAQRSDTALTLIVINKTKEEEASGLNISNFTPAQMAQVYRYSAADLNSIQRVDDIDTGGGVFNATFPASSITLLVIPASQDSMPVPQPWVQLVANAASGDTMLAPAQVVAISGESLGPVEAVEMELTPEGMVSKDLGGVRVLFDGVAGAVLHAEAGMVRAVVPYFAERKAYTHVQVEYLGNRSNSYEAAVYATAPGLDSIQNSDGATNSPDAPAAVGDTATLLVTGAGQTTPPGVDGKISDDIVPAVSAACAVEINGIPAEVLSCTAAPNRVAGWSAIVVRIPDGTPSGPVSVKAKIGDAWTQDGLSLNVQ
jgi:uncharacterized protein (TIGR03437 family)